MLRTVPVFYRRYLLAVVGKAQVLLTTDISVYVSRDSDRVCTDNSRTQKVMKFKFNSKLYLSRMGN